MLKKTKVRTFRDESANKEIPPQIQQLRLPTPRLASIVNPRQVI